MESEKSEWINERYKEIENEVAAKLRDDEQYAALRKQSDLLMEKHPCILQLLEGKGAIPVSEEEHAAFVQYTMLKINEENMERREIYCFGHADCIAYLKRIGAL
jgi:hypothetical protein